MIKKTSLFLIFIACILSGCKERMTGKDVVLDSRIKSEAKTVKIDTVGLFDDFIYARRFLVYQDTVLIVLNNKYEDVYFVEFYNLKQKQLLRQFFRLGNGPDEMLFASHIAIDDNILTVNDITKNQVSFVNIDSALNNPRYSPRVIRHYYGTSIAVRYKEGQLLMENPNCFKSEELGIDQEAPRFVVTADNQPYVENNVYKYFTWNVASDGQIITNMSKDRIMYADFRRPCLQIYNNELELIKQIHGPDQLSIKYQINDNNKVIFKGAYPLSYLGFYSTSDFVYIIHLGEMIKFGGPNYPPVWIFKFDWDGNVLDSYSIGQFIKTISLSADGKSIYATTINEKDNPSLIKITL